MTDKEKAFIDNWQSYHTGMGKWGFIMANGCILAALTHIVFSIAKFFIAGAISVEAFKNYFFNGSFLAEWLLSTLFVGVFLGFIVWKISDIHYIQLTQEEPR
jgi:hypothetical protein